MPDLSTVAAMLSMPDAIATPTCKATYYVQRHAWEFPCGLAIARGLSWQPPGIFWSAMQTAHARHHADCPPVDHWALMDTVETHDNWVKITSICSCREVRRGR